LLRGLYGQSYKEIYRSGRGCGMYKFLLYDYGNNSMETKYTDERQNYGVSGIGNNNRAVGCGVN
jgi:hypothetical protein